MEETTEISKKDTIDEIKEVEEQLQVIKDNAELADRIVHEQLCFMLAVIKKMRNKVEIMAKKDWFIESAKGGIELNPIIIQIQKLAIQAIKLMDDQGLTSVGEIKLMKDGKSKSKKTVMNMLKGENYVYSSESTDDGNGKRKLRRDNV